MGDWEWERASLILFLISLRNVINVSDLLFVEFSDEYYELGFGIRYGGLGGKFLLNFFLISLRNVINASFFLFVGFLDEYYELGFGIKVLGTGSGRELR